MENVRRGVIDFVRQTKANFEYVKNDDLARRTARDLLDQVGSGALSPEAAIERISAIGDKEESDLVLHHYNDFETDAHERSSRS